MSTHDAVVSWALRPGDDFLAGRYSREHLVTFDAGVSVPGSASPAVVRAPWSEEAAADPEELLVASLSACHMLWFLDMAKHAGVLVTGYRDAATARMGRMAANGRIGLVECVLHPRVTALRDGVRVPLAELEPLHHKAHAACNIANSVLTDVRVEPVDAAALQGA